MNCSFPPELSDLQLLLAADGEADADITRHLAGCPSCRQAAAELSRFEQALSRRLLRAACPPALTIGEYRLGLLPPQQADAIARHVAECPHCADELAQLDRFLAEPSPEPDAAALPALRRRVQVLVATLISGGRRLSLPSMPALAPAWAGVRGDDAEPLVYAAGDLTLTLQIEPDLGESGSPARRSLIGLLLGLEQPEAARVDAWHEQRPVATQPVDQLGNFTIDGLTPGHYELIVTAPEVEMHIQDLTVA